MASRLLLLAGSAARATTKRTTTTTSSCNTVSSAWGWRPPSIAATAPSSPPPLLLLVVATRRSFATESSTTKNTAFPDRGPALKKLRAIPFEATRTEADSAFTQYHNRHWLQARQLPALRRGAKETFLPFWVVPPQGAYVRTRLTRASLGVDRLVSRYDSRTGKREPRWETEWTDVALDYDSMAAVLSTEAFGGGTGTSPQSEEAACSRAASAAGVDHCYSPGDPRLQLYAGSPKYARSDARKVGPAWAVGRAKPITPEMLRVSTATSSSTTEGNDDDCRRVGPFIMPPDVARRLLARQLEALEGQRCETVVRSLAPRALRQGGGMAMHVRLLDLRVELLSGELEVAPVYAPVFVFSWRHAGVKVRTMVSGARVGGTTGSSSSSSPLRVAGPILPDETKVAVLTTAAVLLTLQATGAAAAMSSTALFYGGFVLPFIGSGLAARIWPAARTLADRGGERAAEAAAGLAGAGAEAAKGVYARFSSAVERMFGVRLPFSSIGSASAASSSSSTSSSSSSTFDAEYVRAYEQAETSRSRRAAEEEARRARAGHDYGYGGPRGRAGAGDADAASNAEDDDDPFTFTAEDLAEAVRNPFAWAERKAAEMARRHARRRAREQARRDQYERRYGGAYTQREQQQRERYRQQQSSSYDRPRPPGSTARDPQGFYHALGVSPDATTAEIQAAFRGKAMRDHPDRLGPNATETERAAATARFQRLSAAYHCLRDPKRRRDYDLGGGGGGMA